MRNWPLACTAFYRRVSGVGLLKPLGLLLHQVTGLVVPSAWQGGAKRLAVGWKCCACSQEGALRGACMCRIVYHACLLGTRAAAARAALPRPHGRALFRSNLYSANTYSCPRPLLPAGCAILSWLFPCVWGVCVLTTGACACLCWGAATPHLRWGGGSLPGAPPGLTQVIVPIAQRTICQLGCKQDSSDHAYVHLHCYVLAVRGGARTAGMQAGFFLHLESSAMGHSRRAVARAPPAACAWGNAGLLLHHKNTLVSFFALYICVLPSP